MNEKLTTLFHSLKALFFPPSCLLCSTALPPAATILVCTACIAKLPFSKRPLCYCCGREFPDSAPGDHLCQGCLAKPPAFSMARAVLQYTDEVAQLVHSFKYGGRTYCNSSLAGLKTMSPTITDLAEPELIIPVPLHLKRLRERGFNQSVILANLFFPNSKAAINLDILVRKRPTTPQTGLSGKDRRKNLKNAFAVQHPGQLEGRTVLLIDDVFTTGSTLQECAKTLKKYGARDVQALTFARVVE